MKMANLSSVLSSIKELVTGRRLSWEPLRCGATDLLNGRVVRIRTPSVFAAVLKPLGSEEGSPHNGH